MQGVNIICLGRLKESYLRDACKEYEKRLGGSCMLKIYELEPVFQPHIAYATQKLLEMAVN